ncbi:MAG: hypothetical protein Q9218_000609 [Villophora microphyllina]
MLGAAGPCMISLPSQASTIQRTSFALRHAAMSFRKRSVGLSGSTSQVQKIRSEDHLVSAPGVRPSPLDGRLTTSTGTSSLDDLLGHSGFVLGNSILVEEDGTTEFGTTLLRYFAGEGVVQGHKVHIVGVGEPWGRELPGIAGPAGGNTSKLESSTGAEKERMKIAWRYERLGEFGAGPSSARGGTPSILQSAPAVHIKNNENSALKPILESLKEQLASSPKTAIHRLIIPSLLSPAVYPPHASSPQHVLQFLHSLRAILRQHSTQILAMVSLPLMLYPRSAGLTRWMELLSDGVIELSPFPHSIDTGPPTTTAGATTAQEEKPQGMVKVHRLPVFSEKGGGGMSGDDLAFLVSRRKFVIKPFSLPPVEGDTEAQKAPDLPFPIFQISQTVKRYLLYDIKTVSWLRRTHNILGVLIGSLPQSPQQNVFLGLPLELQPEEVRLLVDQELAFIVDDLKSHTKSLQSLPAQLREYKDNVRKEGLAAARAVEKQKRLRTQEALQRLSIRQSTPEVDDVKDGFEDNDTKDEDESLFDVSKSRCSLSTSSNIVPYTSTPTTSYPPLSPPSQQSSPLLPDVNLASYTLFKHLHNHGYFMSPGLRFGCQFLVYPGDPLRFHSHFLAMSAEWDEEIDLLDLVGGGRLGTGVKKGWLIGGAEKYADGHGGNELAPDQIGTTRTEGSQSPWVRTFCIEWGGM